MFEVEINRHFAAHDGRESGSYSVETKTALEAASAAHLAQVAYTGRIFLFVNANRLRGFKSGQTYSLNDGCQGLFITITRIEKAA